MCELIRRRDSKAVGSLSGENPRTPDSGFSQALAALTRTLVANMVVGVSVGFEKRTQAHVPPEAQIAHPPLRAVVFTGTHSHAETVSKERTSEKKTLCRMHTSEL